MDKEHELLALKARKARILNGLPEPKKLVWNEENAPTINELCEVERRIAKLEGRNPLEIYKIVPNSEQPDDAEHPFYYTSDRIDYPGQIWDLDARREEMREELEKMANDRDALRELMGEDEPSIPYPTGNEIRQLFGYPPISGETAVEHPSHYTSGGIECIDAMKAMLAGYEQAKIVTKFYWHFLSGQVFKYLWRWPLKERPLQDLKKARWYLDRLIDDVENQDHAVTELNFDMGKEISE